MDYSMNAQPGPPILLRGTAKDCCTNRSNLELYKREGAMEVYRCMRCGCRHFEMLVAPGSVGVKGV